MPLDLDAIRADLDALEALATERAHHRLILRKMAVLIGHIPALLADAETTCATLAERDAEVERLRNGLEPLVSAFDGYTIEVRSVSQYEGVDSADGETPCLHVIKEELRGMVRKEVREALDRARAALEGKVDA